MINFLLNYFLASFWIGLDQSFGQSNNVVPVIFEPDIFSAIFLFLFGVGMPIITIAFNYYFMTSENKVTNKHSHWFLGRVLDSEFIENLFNCYFDRCSFFGMIECQRSPLALARTKSRSVLMNVFTSIFFAAPLTNFGGFCIKRMIGAREQSLTGIRAFLRTKVLSGFNGFICLNFLATISTNYHNSLAWITGMLFHVLSMSNMKASRRTIFSSLIDDVTRNYFKKIATSQTLFLNPSLGGFVSTFSGTKFNLIPFQRFFTSLASSIHIASRIKASCWISSISLSRRYGNQQDANKLYQIIRLTASPRHTHYSTNELLRVAK